MNKLKYSSIMSLFVMTALLFASCGKSGKDKTQTEKQQTEQTQSKTQKKDTLSLKEAKYVCPMHPLERSKEPGKCPICKMNLVSLDEHNKEMSEMHESIEKKNAGKKDLIHFEVNLSVIKSDDCIMPLETALKKDPGVIDYYIDIINRIIHMYIDKSKTTKSNVEQLISDAGFDANSKKANPDAAGRLPESCK